MATLCLSLKQTKPKKLQQQNTRLFKSLMEYHLPKKRKTIHLKNLNGLFQRRLWGNQVLQVHFANEALPGVPGTLGGMLTAGSLVLAER